jgi:hypothetical protein
VTAAFWIFAGLQIVDLVTTLAVLHLGGAEQNRLVLGLMLPGTLFGLLCAKLIALGIGAFCELSGRRRVLWVANTVYVGLMAWNVDVLIRLITRA